MKRGHTHWEKEKIGWKRTARISGRMVGGLFQGSQSILGTYWAKNKGGKVGEYIAVRVQPRLDWVMQLPNDPSSGHGTGCRVAAVSALIKKRRLNPPFRGFC